MINCTTVVDRDQNLNAREIVYYTVTFDPCVGPNITTARYQNRIEIVGGQVTTVADNTTNQEISQPFGEGNTLNLVVIQTENGITFGVSKIFLLNTYNVTVQPQILGFNFDS